MRSRSNELRLDEGKCCKQATCAGEHRGGRDYKKLAGGTRRHDGARVASHGSRNQVAVREANGQNRPGGAAAS